MSGRGWVGGMGWNQSVGSNTGEHKMRVGAVIVVQLLHQSSPPLYSYSIPPMFSPIFDERPYGPICCVPENLTPVRRVDLASAATTNPRTEAKGAQKL